MIDVIASLDGYGAAEGWPGLWGMAGPEHLAFLAEDGAAGCLTLMGATTYRQMSGYAAEAPPDDPGFAGLTVMPKVVFPVVNGATGTDRIFDGWPDVALDVVQSRLLDGRLQLLEYVPRVLDGTPGA
jgi:hypothetical protein